ncbi:TetR/AcrR family transcriptional regulator [Micromonospora sp. CNB394]|uniref:TetR/AcrR family transcriptional regulator n=1 Tax=Micromonospora sp. CNB394 TaxID=1169151 RepID=UPI003510C930
MSHVSPSPPMEPRRCSPSRAAAGVGQGTLYRHFPTREALLAEVYREDFEELTSAASELVKHHPPLWG